MTFNYVQQLYLVLDIQLNSWMSNSYVMSTGSLECAPTYGKKAVITQVFTIRGWYSIKAVY